MNAENSIHLISEKSMSSRVHLKVLDGWRGLSILLVLASHLLPLGPKNLQLNMSVGILGMVLFFNLSGFLITSFLLEDRNIQTFLIRRFFRVIPLAWLYLAIALAFSSASIYSWMAHYLFYANLPPVELVTLTEHIWSLCAEVQFYVGVAILVSILKVRSLFLLPIFGLLFTALRIWNGIPASSITYYRIDEILAGCTLALIYHGQPRHFLKNLIRQMPQLPILILVVFSCMPQGRWLNYFRPYLAAALIGTTILREDSSLARGLDCQFFIYLAGISYSLYVIHPLLAGSWLGSGDVYEKYAKRPLLFAVLFALAYLSTNYYEKWFILFGRNLAEKFGAHQLTPRRAP
jgi:peptidoglycan/LPS O-acetylase OafA/YrhL